MAEQIAIEDSYSDRRKLFRNIFKNDLAASSPRPVSPSPTTRVIKTLRVDGVNTKKVADRRKKRLRNLRLVCNRILEFCDRQEVDDPIHKARPQSSKCDNQPKKNISPARPPAKRESLLSLTSPVSSPSPSPSRNMRRKTKRNSKRRKTLEKRAQPASPPPLNKLAYTDMSPKATATDAAMTMTVIRRAGISTRPGRTRKVAIKKAVSLSSGISDT